MSDASNHERFRLIALLVLVGVAALASFWLLEVLRKSGQETSGEEKLNEPDYFIENFHFVRISPTGLPHYIMSGKHLTHRPLNDLSDINNAQMLAFNASQAPLTVKANEAQIEHQGNRVQLLGDVNMVRAANAVSSGWQMKSQALLILPDDDQMMTDKPVEIVNGNSVLNGSGMFVDNTNGLFRLARQVHGVFLPAAKTDGKPAAKAGK